MMGVTMDAGARRLGVPTIGYAGSQRSWGRMNEMGYILVVDDDDGICDVIEAVLSDEGYEVVCARNGGHALRVLQERVPVLVLFDLVMPDRSGADFIAACRQVPNGSVPMIVVSAMPNLDQIAVGRPMIDKEEALTRLEANLDSIRHHTIAKIKVRRQFRERHNDVSIDFLLLSARRDFLAERRLVRLAKRNIEEQLGEGLGPVRDQDGHLI
jgi:CheY-like chemotaxis protein